MAKVKLDKMTGEQIAAFFRKSGAQGGKERARRHKATKLREWGTLGGRPQTIGAQVMEVLTSKPQTSREIAKKLNTPVRQVSDLLSHMRKKKRVKQVKDGKPYVKWVKA